MGNAQCCDDLRTEDYKSQVADPTLQHYQNPNLSPHYQPHNKSNEIEKTKKEEHEPLHIAPEPPIEKTKKQESIIIVEQPRHDIPQEPLIEIPILLPAVSARLAKEKLARQPEEGSNVGKKIYGKEIYWGQLDRNGRYPDGFGRLYKQDGSLFMGEFVKGRAEGEGVLIMADGSIFKGILHNNEAKGEGYYQSDNLKYTGLFLHNKFHGWGKEKGENYEFQGDFYEGNRSNGKFIWKEGQAEYTYDGHFNFSNQFQGKGVLTEPQGTYEGEFKNGLKDGQGIYKYSNGLRYQGGYKQGHKHGSGKLFNYNNSIAFDGIFAHDLPNGLGTTYNDKGQKSTVNWVNGIDASLLS